MTTAFSIKEALAFGWEVFKKEPWFYISIVTALTVFSIIVDTLLSGGTGAASFFGFLVSLMASTIVSIAYARLALSAAAGGTPVGWDGLWVPTHFFPMLGTIVLQTIMIIIGLILLVIPGIIVGTLLMFSQLAVVDKSLNPVEAIQESIRLVRPHLWQMFLFALALFALNVVGLLALVVGLLVTIPISLIASAHVYKKLATQNIPATAPAVAEHTETPNA